MQLCAVATDGKCLSKIVASAPDGLQLSLRAIIPTKAVSELRKLAATTPGMVHLDVSDVALRIRAGNHDFTTKLIDGQFPDYARVIPPSAPSVSTFDRDELAAAVARAATVLASRSGAIRLDLRETEIEVSAFSDGDQASEVIEATLSGPPAFSAFNGKILADALVALGGGELTIGMDSPTSPALLRGADEAGHVYVLMPLRVPDAP